MKKFEKKTKTGVANTDEGHCIVTETFDTNLNLVVIRLVRERKKSHNSILFWLNLLFWYLLCTVVLVPFLFICVQGSTPYRLAFCAPMLKIQKYCSDSLTMQHIIQFAIFLVLATAHLTSAAVSTVSCIIDKQLTILCTCTCLYLLAS